MPARMLLAAVEMRTFHYTNGQRLKADMHLHLPRNPLGLQLSNLEPPDWIEHKA